MKKLSIIAAILLFLGLITVYLQEEGSPAKKQRESVIYSSYKILPMVSNEEYDTSAIKNSLWKKFDLAHYNLPLPYKNPVFVYVPKITVTGTNKAPLIGFELKNHSGELLFQFITQEKINFRYLLPESELPEHINYQILSANLEQYGLGKIWKDFFSLVKKEKLDILGVNYYAYIDALRKKYLGQAAIALQWSPESKQGLVIRKSENKNFQIVEVWQLIGSSIYRFSMKTLKFSREAVEARDYILKEIIYRESVESDARIWYEQFKVLSYPDKISGVGLLYLYSAWSQAPLKKSFVREMIRYLEKGKNNLIYLTPLYKFVTDQFKGDLRDFKQNKIDYDKSIDKDLDQRDAGYMEHPEDDLKERIKKAKSTKKKSKKIIIN